MNLLKNSLTTILSIVWLTNAFGQVGDAYARAAATARTAATKTKCPETKSYCLKVATWCDCMVQIGKTGVAKDCGNQPASPAPCKDDMIGGSTSSSTTSSSSTNDPIKEFQLSQQRLQQELNNAQNASTSAFENAINSGKKTSGAMVDATLAGAQYISDPKASLAYTGVGLAVAGLAAISERNEAKIEARQQELRKLKESLSVSTSILNFASGVTSYHITNLKVIKKSNGRIKSVIRTNLYDVYVRINSIRNTSDSITIFESVNFKNITTSSDSTIINKVVFAIADIKEAAAYSGNYTNSYNYTTDSYDNYRYKELDNSSIEHAFTMQGDFPQLPSGLTDIYIKTRYDAVAVYSKYFSGNSYNLSEDDFKDAHVRKTDSYLLVFDNLQNRVTDFVDYINAIK